MKTVIVCCGPIRRKELCGLTLHPDVSMVEPINVVLENAERRKAEFELSAKTSTDRESTLDRLKPDMVVDCPPPGFHAVVAYMAMGHGARVLG